MRRRFFPTAAWSRRRSASSSRPRAKPRARAKRPTNPLPPTPTRNWVRSTLLSDFEDRGDSGHRGAEAVALAGYRGADVGLPGELVIEAQGEGAASDEVVVGQGVGDPADVAVLVDAERDAQARGPFAAPFAPHVGREGRFRAEEGAGAETCGAHRIARHG